MHLQDAQFEIQMTELQEQYDYTLRDEQVYKLNPKVTNFRNSAAEFPSIFKQLEIVYAQLKLKFNQTLFNPSVGKFIPERTNL